MVKSSPNKKAPSGPPFWDLPLPWFLLYGALLLLLQAWLKFFLAYDQPFGGEQARDWVLARQFLASGAIPAFGPPMAVGPPLPGGWYYFILEQGLRLFGDAPIGLSWWCTILYTCAAAYLMWRMSRRFGRFSALAVVALLSFHPIVLAMTSLYHNPNIAFCFLTAALAAVCAKRVGALQAAVAGFCGVVALQCDLAAAVVLGAPLAWFLARRSGRGDWSFSWRGWLSGFALGCAGYLPYLLQQAHNGFQNVTAGTKYRRLMHLNLNDQVLRPIFFFATQPDFEASSYFAHGWRGFIHFFRFRTPGDLWAFAATAATIALILWLNLQVWWPVFRRGGRRAGTSLFEPWDFGVFRVLTLSLPFWFIAAGRFDVKYTGMFMAWSYLPVAGWLSRHQAAWDKSARWACVLALALACATGIGLHRRIYRQKGGVWSSFPRLSYRSVDLSARSLARGRPKTAALIFDDGMDGGVANAIFQVAALRYGWRGARADAGLLTSGDPYRAPGARLWKGKAVPAALRFMFQPMDAAEARRGDWQLLACQKGVYIYQNF